MSVLSRLLKQCRKPTGRFGRLLARGMNVGHATLTKWELEHVDIGEALIALDIGCGGGGTLRRLATAATSGMAVGIDYSEASVAVSRRKNHHLIREGRVAVLLASVSSTPFADATFDLATAVETLYFWPALQHDLLEIKRVLRPGGNLVIACAVYKGSRFERRNRRVVRASGMTYLSPDELARALQTAGYRAVDVSQRRARGWIRAIAVA